MRLEDYSRMYFEYDGSTGIDICQRIREKCCFE